MVKITLDEFCGHWLDTAVRALDHRIFEFTTAAGKYTKECFEKSFAKGGFYGSGTAWPACESRWAKKFQHPTLHDSGTLSNSLDPSQPKESQTNIEQSAGHGLRKISRHGSYYNIHTTEINKPVTGRRGKNKNARGYAAIHNTPHSADGYKFTVNQHSSRKPVQRQFIGFSPLIDEHILSSFLGPINAFFRVSSATE